MWDMVIYGGVGLVSSVQGEEGDRYIKCTLFYCK